MAAFELGFFRRFMIDRIEYLERDIRVCLRSYRSKLTDKGSGGKAVHAYWPALASCLANLEFTVGLHVGKFRDVCETDRIGFTKLYLPSYDQYILRLLWVGFRHKIAHGARPQFVIDTSRDRRFAGPPRRITWYVSEKIERTMIAESGHKHLELVPDIGSIRTPIRPYDVPFDHRFYLSLRKLKDDVKVAMARYAHSVETDIALQSKSMAVIGYLFPPP